MSRVKLIQVTIIEGIAYPAGTEVDVDEALCTALVNMGVAVAVSPPAVSADEDK